MTRKHLLDLICPSKRMQNCEDYHCVDCNILLIKWLDEYDKQIKADAIDEFLAKVKEKYPTDKNALYHLTRIADELKAGDKDSTTHD